MKALSHTPFRHILLGLVTLALLALPFTHRVGAAPLSTEMAEYLVMGGTMAELCGDTDTAPAGGCESCRIEGAMHLTPPQPAWCAAQRGAAFRLALNSQTPAAPRPANAQHLARAPPLV